MKNKVGEYKHVHWLGTGALVVCIGHGLANHPGIAIEEVNAQTTTLATNIGATCELASYSLDELVQCITQHMPAAGSGDYVVPSGSIQNDWRTLVQDLVAINDISECGMISIPSSLSGVYEVFPFYDAYNGWRMPTTT